MNNVKIEKTKAAAISTITYGVNNYIIVMPIVHVTQNNCDTCNAKQTLSLSIIPVNKSCCRPTNLINAKDSSFDVSLGNWSFGLVEKCFL